MKIVPIRVTLNLDKQDFDALGAVGLCLSKTQPVYLMDGRHKKKKGTLKKSVYTKTAMVRRAIKEFIARNKDDSAACSRLPDIVPRAPQR